MHCCLAKSATLLNMLQQAGTNLVQIWSTDYITAVWTLKQKVCTKRLVCGSHRSGIAIGNYMAFQFISFQGKKVFLVKLGNLVSLSLWFVKLSCTQSHILKKRKARQSSKASTKIWKNRQAQRQRGTALKKGLGEREEQQQQRAERSRADQQSGRPEKESSQRAERSPESHSTNTTQ